MELKYNFDEFIKQEEYFNAFVTIRCWKKDVGHWITMSGNRRDVICKAKDGEIDFVQFIN